MTVFSFVTFSAVELRSDKIYHLKAENNSYKKVYLVKLYEFWPVLVTILLEYN